VYFYIFLGREEELGIRTSVQFKEELGILDFCLKFQVLLHDLKKI
jgi:hypothetical protein